MKHGQLCSIAHNIADSIVSGMCFPIGIYSIDIFYEAAKTLNGRMEIDIIAGEVVGETTSGNVMDIAKLYAKELPNFCDKHGAAASDFIKLNVIFYKRPLIGHVQTIVTDVRGKTSIIEYAGVPLKRLRTSDGLGRVRKK